MRSLLRACAARGGASLLTRRRTNGGSHHHHPSSIESSSSSGSVAPQWRSPRLVSIDASSSSSSSTSTSSTSNREHPPFPRVGVAAVLFKPRTETTQEEEEPSLLLIKRAKSPNQGLWSFPGGALELGEALVAGAERELSEEVPGLEFERESAVAGGLAGGVAFAAADSIHFEEDSEEEGGEGGREGGGRGEAEEAGSSGGSGEKRRSEKTKSGAALPLGHRRGRRGRQVELLLLLRGLRAAVPFLPRDGRRRRGGKVGASPVGASRARGEGGGHPRVRPRRRGGREALLEGSGLSSGIERG